MLQIYGRYRVGINSNYSQEEIEYVENNWGVKSPEIIAKNLNRPTGGIINLVSRRQLGAFLDNGDYPSNLLKQICHHILHR